MTEQRWLQRFGTEQISYYCGILSHQGIKAAVAKFPKPDTDVLQDNGDVQGPLLAALPPALNDKDEVGSRGLHKSSLDGRCSILDARQQTVRKLPVGSTDRRNTFNLRR